MAWPSTGSYTAWSKCFKVTSQASKISAVNSWYFLDLSLMPSAFWSAVQADGDDLRFTQDDGETAVNHKLIYINTGTSKGLVAVAQPHGSSGATSDIDTYCYVGNSGASSTGTSSTFPSSMTCLYMLQEEPTSATAILDWTSNARHSTAIAGSMTSGDLVSGGPHGGLKAVDFDSNDRATIPGDIFNDCETNNAFTWFGWGRLSTESNNGIFGALGVQFRVRRNTTSSGMEAAQRNAANSANFTTSFASNAADMIIWYHWAAVYNGSTLKLYQNGVEVGSVAATSLQTAAVDYYIGHDNVAYARARLAEIGLYSAAFSADKIATIYANETDSGFWVVAEHTGGGGGNTGTGALTGPGMPSVSGSGKSTHVGTGNTTAPIATLSGSGIVGKTGTGSVAAPAATVEGAGIVGKTGTGALTAPVAALEGAGVQVVNATGDLVAPVATLYGEGTGTVPVSGTGAIEAPMPSVSGVGIIESGDQDLVGALTAAAAVISASAITGKTGTASLVAPMPIVAASGTQTISGSGALIAPSAYVVSGSGVLSPPAIVGTGSLTGYVPTISGTGFVIDGDEATVDAVAWYTSGASSEGKSQRDQALSLGGFRSGTPIKCMTWDCEQPMVGVEILDLNALNGVGSGSLEAITESTIAWTPPNGVRGTAVSLPVGGEAQLFGFDSGAWIRVRRISEIPMVGIHTVQCMDMYNNVVAFENVASADAVAGKTSYRAIMGHNPYAGPMINMKVWLDGEANENIYFGLELAVNGEVQTIADETTEPAGIAWSSVYTEETAWTLPSVESGGSFAIWIKRYIAADSAPTPRLLNYIHTKFSDLAGVDHYDDLRGKYRIARDDYVTYGLWLGQDAQPDFSLSPDDTFTSRPHTTALSLDVGHTYYAAIRQRNKWGLWSQNMTTTTLVMLSDGEQGYVPPSEPSAVAITQASGSENYPVISARYEPAIDGDNRADFFVVWYTRDDSTPDPTNAPNGYGTMNTRSGIQVLKYTASGLDFLDGTPIKALVRTRRAVVGSGDAFSPDTTQLPASGAGTIVVASELAGWDATGLMKITSFSGETKEIVEYDSLTVGVGVSTFNILSGGRAQWGTTASATVASDVVYPITAVDSTNTTIEEYEIDGIEPGRPWGDLLFGNEAGQQQDPIAGPDGVTPQYIDETDNIYLMSGEGWTELWMDTTLVWKVFQDAADITTNVLCVPSEWTLVIASVSGTAAATGVFDYVSPEDLYLLAGDSRKVKIDLGAMTITMPTLSVLGDLPEVAPQFTSWEQYAGSLLQSWDPNREDYRPYLQVKSDGTLASQWTIDNSLTQLEIVAL